MEGSTREQSHPFFVLCVGHFKKYIFVPEDFSLKQNYISDLFYMDFYGLGLAFGTF